ncbi:hypothetical protein FKM82_030146 [Ascaphus truei]
MFSRHVEESPVFSGAPYSALPRPCHPPRYHLEAGIFWERGRETPVERALFSFGSPSRRGFELEGPPRCTEHRRVFGTLHGLPRRLSLLWRAGVRIPHLSELRQTAAPLIHLEEPSSAVLAGFFPSSFYFWVPSVPRQ